MEASPSTLPDSSATDCQDRCQGFYAWPVAKRLIAADIKDRVWISGKDKTAGSYANPPNRCLCEHLQIGLCIWRACSLV
jgi:hypothetical protein